jgi:precorrin-6Y C5,15-methyltransferase (decarboxylating)
MKISVCGVGPGGSRHMTSEVKENLSLAELVLTSLKDCSFLPSHSRYMSFPDMMDFIEENKESELNLSIAASGDTGFYSIAGSIKRKFPGLDLRVYPGISSFSLLSARVCIGYEDARLVSLHGRDGSALPYVTYNRKVFFLTGGKVSVSDIIKELEESPLNDRLKLIIGERLGLEGERISEGKPSDFENESFEDPVSLIALNESPTNPYKSLSDSDFIRGKAPMTKATVRRLVTSLMELEPGDTVYDIGAGTGSVTCQMAYGARDSFVYAMEKIPERIELIEKNMDKTGAYNIKPLCGEASELIKDLPLPDKVFIGGSSGRLKEIIDMCLSKNPEVKILLSAISLETLEEGRKAFLSAGIEAEIFQLTAAEAKKLGNYNLMMGENPVYLMRGCRGDGKKGDL